MKYVSIDLETTGLNPLTCQILEFGAVVDDLDNLKPLEELPKFHAYVLPSSAEVSMANLARQEVVYMGEPFALQMNAGILAKIANRKNNREDLFLCEDELASEFNRFLKKNGLTEKVLAAGKNYGTFDKRFLDAIPEWSNIKFHHRVLDPMMLFMRKSDQEPPRLSTCLERAGLNPVITHNALEDALQVVQLIRKGLGYEG